MESKQNNQNTDEIQATKKVSLAEAAKMALAQKRAKNNNNQSYHESQNKKMNSQITKKTNNQRRKMGS
jgi:hypothetical protein